MRTPVNEHQQELPVQPVENPILCGPYVEPDQHWVYDSASGEAMKMPGRRPASYWFKTKRTSAEQQAQLALTGFAEEQRDELPLVNALRNDVRRWRKNGYPGATPVTKRLLSHWWREDRPRRLFFCQLEAVETVIYLVERRARDNWRQFPGFQPEFTDADYDRLVDTPAEAYLLPLVRYGSKMATGSGKTVVMAMLIAWAFCNRGQVPSAETFPRAVLVCCPNLTVKERLQVLRPEHPDNYYAAFDLAPTAMRPLLQSGKVLVSNWHAFAPESEHAENGKSYAVVNKGPESPEAFAKRVLGDLYDLGPVMVLNDEAHHAYRPAPLEEHLTGEEARRAKSDRCSNKRRARTRAPTGGTPRRSSAA